MFQLLAGPNMHSKLDNINHSWNCVWKRFIFLSLLDLSRTSKIFKQFFELYAITIALLIQLGRDAAFGHFAIYGKDGWKHVKVFKLWLFTGMVDTESFAEIICNYLKITNHSTNYPTYRKLILWSLRKLFFFKNCYHEPKFQSRLIII